MIGVATVGKKAELACARSVERSNAVYDSAGITSKFAADKGRKIYDGGHVFPFSRMIGDSLDWLDRYLGTPN